LKKSSSILWFSFQILKQFSDFINQGLEFRWLHVVGDLPPTRFLLPYGLIYQPDHLSNDVPASAFTLFGYPFHGLFLIMITECWWKPIKDYNSWMILPLQRILNLSSSIFTRRYWWNHCCFLFLPLIICLNSGGSLLLSEVE
jgi:hypothetical protein